MSSEAGKDHIAGLDAIRGLCALWVVFSHLGFLPGVADVVTEPALARAVLRGLLGNLFSGTPAVMVFFVVSGFCIHFPHTRGGGRAPGGAFLVRRFIRIALPFASAWVLVQWFAPRSQGLAVVQWSLIAEVIYYLLYPVLFRLRQRLGWPVWITLAAMVALVVISLRPPTRYMWDLGWALTWLVGLPHWLAGCLLAEWVVRDQKESTLRGIWIARILTWAAASLASVVQFHLHIGYPLTMLAFTPIAFVWVRAEIRWQARHPALPCLKWLGLWSYSIYLLHLVAPDVFQAMGLRTGPRAGLLVWATTVAGALGVCLLFHYLVERPSHQFARWVGRRLSSSSAPTRSTGVASNDRHGEFS